MISHIRCLHSNLSHIHINDLLKVSLTIIIISSKSITLQVHSSTFDLWYTRTYMNNVRGNSTRMLKSNPNSVQKNE